MKHRFYMKSKKERNKIQLLIGFFALITILTALFISWITAIVMLSDGNIQLHKKGNDQK